MITDSYFKGTVESDFFHLMAGERLGGGEAREVYACNLNEDYVVKIETGGGSFQNIREWDLWQDAVDMGEDVSKWLAPCHSISTCGSVIIQRRTKPIGDLPKKMPVFLADFKRSNFGILDGRIVAHDYGVHVMRWKGLSEKLKKVEWIDE